ncbi:MAG: tRNA-dihydrouridine synthase [Clostridia bacterium]|nr:tRNA-dihydrouridine synthase [Clostridia bacterium]
MRIGNITLSSNVILAPLAGYTDVGFRHLAKVYGAGLTYTEMVSAKGLMYENENTQALLVTSPLERPSGVQLFGSDADIISEQAGKLDFDIVDINMGCPVPKIVKNGDGSALMRDPDLAYRIVKATAQVLHAQGKALTVKFRKSCDGVIEADEFAKVIESAGADAITVHGRTREEMYRGKADRQIIARTVKAVSIPVIANGDILTQADYLECMDIGCSGVMIGRGALGNPEIFSTIRGIEVETSKRDLALEHVDLLRPHFSERYVVNTMKKHVCYYAGGRRGSRAVKEAVFGATNYDSLYEAIMLIPD